MYILWKDLNPSSESKEKDLNILSYSDQHILYTYIPKFICRSTYFEDILTKNLRISKLTYPVDSLRRAFKFNEKGFKPCKNTLFNLSKALNDIDKNMMQSMSIEHYYLID